MDETDRPDCSSRQRDPLQQRHWEWLLICGLVLSAAPLLTVLPDDRVALRGAESIVLPATCPSRELLGLRCPACGLTRSFVFLARGDWHSSLRVHRVGWAVMALIALQIPYRALALAGWRRHLLGPVGANCVVVAAFVLLLGNWIVGILLFANS